MANGIIMGNIKSMGILTVAVDHASCAANTSIETTVTVKGLSTNDMVYVSKPTLEAGYGVVNARVSAADTLAIQVINTTAGAIDETSETYQVLWVKPASLDTAVRD